MHLLLLALDRNLTGTLAFVEDETVKIHVYFENGLPARVTRVGAAADTFEEDLLSLFDLPAETSFVFYNEFDARPNAKKTPTDPLPFLLDGIARNPPLAQLTPALSKLAAVSLQLQGDTSRFNFGKKEQAALRVLESGVQVFDFLCTCDLETSRAEALIYLLVIMKLASVAGTAKPKVESIAKAPSTPPPPKETTSAKPVTASPRPSAARALRLEKARAAAAKITHARAEAAQAEAARVAAEQAAAEQAAAEKTARESAARERAEAERAAAERDAKPRKRSSVAPVAGARLARVQLVRRAAPIVVTEIQAPRRPSSTPPARSPRPPASESSAGARPSKRPKSSPAPKISSRPPRTSSAPKKRHSVSPSARPPAREERTSKRPMSSLIPSVHATPVVREMPRAAPSIPPPSSVPDSKEMQNIVANIRASILPEEDEWSFDSDTPVIIDSSTFPTSEDPPEPSSRAIPPPRPSESASAEEGASNQVPMPPMKLWSGDKRKRLPSLKLPRVDMPPKKKE